MTDDDWSITYLLMTDDWLATDDWLIYFIIKMTDDQWLMTGQWLTDDWLTDDWSMTN